MASTSPQIIAVVGAGTMGHGIAHVAARSGFGVILHDINQALIDKGITTVQKEMNRGVEKGRMTAEERDASLGRIRTATSLEPLAEGWSKQTDGRGRAYFYHSATRRVAWKL